MSNAGSFINSPPDNETTQFVGSSLASSVLEPGTLLGNTYIIGALLARGGMGEVYRARHVELGTEHAIKVMLPTLAGDPNVVQLFREEARKLRRVNNEAIVDYEGFFRDQNGLRFLVMEFVPGESLEEVLRRRRLEPGEVLRLRDRLAFGLAAAHEMGIVHRDVSPGNILLPEGKFDRAKLIDFGIAKSTNTAAQTVVGNNFAGKHSYVSPEQLGMFGGHIDLRSDIYSLGLVLAAAAIGFGGKLDMGSSAPTMIAARQRVPDLAPVPTSLRPVIEPMLQPRPEDRPPSMRALVELEGGPIRSRAKASNEKTVARNRIRRPIWAAAGALVAICALTGAIAVFWKLPSIEDIRSELVIVTRDYPCSDLSYSVAPNREVQISGFAATPADVQQLRQAVERISGISQLSYNVELRRWPHCAITAVLKPLAQQNERNHATVTLASNNGEAHIGSPLLLDIRAPPFDGYLYIDYFPQDDRVRHLLPNAEDLDNHKPVGNRFVLGRWPMKQCWTMSGEVGTQLISLVSSSRKLFASPRPEVEKVDDYLHALTQALGASRDATRDASMLFFELKAKDIRNPGSEPNCPSG